MKFKHYQTKSTFLTDLGDNKIVSGDICFIKDAQQIYTHGTYYDCSSDSGSQSDWNQNDTTADDYIKNRTHYVESVSYTDKWNQSNVEVGSGSSSPGAYSGTFTVTAGNKYRVIITNGNNSKTYTDIEAEYNSSLNGMLLNKNWSNPMYGAETTSDAFCILVQASSVILSSVDVYGSNCTVQVSEITENVKKLDRKYLPALNEIDSISSSKSGKVTTVTITETNGDSESFNISDGVDGQDGDDGKSAYQVAVDNGYVGTEAQWLASLKGDSGVDLGQVAMTQTITGDDDKVPSDKAVRDGIEVWRSSVTDYIYESSNVAFGGTDVVDTEINLYNPEIDFEIKMTISNLTWLSGATNNSGAGILSCGNTASPYRGFSLQRGTSSSKIMLWLDGSRRFASNLNTGSGSTNTFYIKKVGNDYIFQVNGGTLNTYTSTVDNSTAFILKIGGTDNKSSFTLDSIVVKNLNDQDVQLYSDYAKDKKIYPNIRVSNIINREALNPESFIGTWATYNSTQFPNMIPGADGVISVLIDSRYGFTNESAIKRFTLSDSTNANNFEIEVNGNVIYLRSKVAGTSYNKYLVEYNRYMEFIITFNFNTGDYVVYGNALSRLTGTYTLAQIPSPALFTKVNITNAYTGGKKFFAVFNYLITQEQAEEILGTYPQEIFPQKYMGTTFGNLISVDLSSATASGTNVSYSDRTATSIKVTTNGAAGSYSFVHKSRWVTPSIEREYYSIYKMHIQVLSGGVTIKGFGSDQVAGDLYVYDNQGNLLGNKTAAGVLTAGDYDLVHDGALPQTWNDAWHDKILWFGTSESTVFIFSNLTKQRRGAPIYFSPQNYYGEYWLMPNGNKIPVGGGLTPLTDIYKPNVSTLSYPQYSGQLKMDADGTIYMGNINKSQGVWKQINNS